MLTYSNPRRQLTVQDWPSGKQKTEARFRIEVANNGRERACRITVNPKTGRDNAEKKLTYAMRMRFVDGSDGRLYVIKDNTDYGHITVMKGTFDYNEETIHKTDPRFAEIFALFNQ